MIELKCKYCGKLFRCYPSQNKNNRRRYCSKPCRIDARADQMRRQWSGKQPPWLHREKRMQECSYCGSTFHQKTKKQRYCSIGCNNRGRHIGKPKKVRVYSRKRTDTWAQVQVQCDYCGKQFSLARWEAQRVKHHFCRNNELACYKAWLSEHRRGRNHPSFGKKPSKKSGRGRGGFVQDIGHYVRSTWEANVARWLKANGIEYMYEPQTFDLGEFSYTPDFYLPDRDQYIEVKGVWTDKERRKLKAFQDLGYDLWIIDYDGYSTLGFDPEETR